MDLQAGAVAGAVQQHVHRHCRLPNGLADLLGTGCIHVARQRPLHQMRRNNARDAAVGGNAGTV